MSNTEKEEEIEAEGAIENEDDIDAHSAHVLFLPYPTVQLLNKGKTIKKQNLRKIMRTFGESSTLMDVVDSKMKEQENLKEKINIINAIDEKHKKNNANINLDGLISFLQKGWSSFDDNSSDFEGSINCTERNEYRVIYEKLHEFIEEEFPIKDQNPTLRETIHVGEKTSDFSYYKPGDWVEIRGPDMKWSLDMITRVIRKAPDDWDWTKENEEPNWNFSYNAGELRGINENNLRAPECGLKKVFGLRPWVWQQWALLKVEQRIR